MAAGRKSRNNLRSKYEGMHKMRYYATKKGFRTELPYMPIMQRENQKEKKTKVMKRDVTDDQIVAEAKMILEDKRLRKCSQCSKYDEKTHRCSFTGQEYSAFTYAGNCVGYETNEQKLVREAREAMAQLEKEERKLNHLLTMTINSIEMALLFLEDFSTRIEKEYKRAEAKRMGDPRCRKNDREWIGKMTRSMKQMNNLIEGVRRQYTHYIEPQLNRVFMDKESGSYDAVSYDDHLSDVYEISKLTLMYFDKAYESKENADAVFNLLESLHGCEVMESADYKRYNFVR
jgi:hypothetical protein